MVGFSAVAKFTVSVPFSAEETCLLEERREVDEPSDGRDALPGRPVDLEAASERGHVHRGPVALDEIFRLRHLKPRRRYVTITHVAFLLCLDGEITSIQKKDAPRYFQTR